MRLCGITTSKWKINVLADNLTRGDIMYLLHVSGNMLEMTEGKGGEARRVRFIAYCIRRVCRLIIYGRKK